VLPLAGGLVFHRDNGAVRVTIYLQLGDDWARQLNISVYLKVEAGRIASLRMGVASIALRTTLKSISRGDRRCFPVRLAPSMVTFMIMCTSTRSANWRHVVFLGIFA